MIQVRHKGFKEKILSKKEKAAAINGPTKSFSKKKTTEKKKKKPSTTYTQYDPKDAETFALCDAMRLV